VAETVIEGTTGCFFDEPDPAALAEAVRCFDPDAVDPAACVANAQRFELSVFHDGIRSIVDDALAAGPSPRGERRRPVRGLALAGRRAAAA
jgi:hypothetical protein